MALFQLNLINSDQVIEWADKQIIKDSEPFDDILKLSTKGPKYCSRLVSTDFPAARELSYIEMFALKTAKLNPGNKEALEQFIQWVIRASLDAANNYELPEVQFGYFIDHYYYDCEDPDLTYMYIEESLTTLAPKNKPIADAIWAEIE